MPRRIVLSRGATLQLKAIETYLAAAMSDDRTAEFVDGLVADAVLLLISLFEARRARI